MFRLFAQSAKLQIPPKSIEKRDPPKPDICCELAEYGRTCFELVETIDTSLAQAVAGQFRLQETLRDEATRVLRGFADALIFVRYVRSALVQHRVQSVPALVAYLGGLAAGFEGDVMVPAGSSLSVTVRSVHVTRGGFVGPVFQVEAGTFISDPVIERIKSKFNKRYETENRIELLAFYELQPTQRAEMKLPEVEAFVQANLHASQFSRVWIFDVGNRTVLFSSDRI